MPIKVSVIVPIYNAAALLPRCCHALMRQTLPELEVVFVDDCSTDNSRAIVRQLTAQYPERREHVRLVSLPSNGGVGAARKAGAEAATGQYLIHCDADDWPEPTMYQRLYDAAISEDADMVVCGYTLDRTAGASLTVLPPDGMTFDISPIEGAVWNKLISRRLIEENDIAFSPDLILGEDFLYVNRCRTLARKVAVLRQPLYHYTLDNATSITRGYDARKCESVVAVAARMEEHLRRHGLMERYASHLNYLKYQAKGFYLMFPRTRDLDRYARLFPECEGVCDQYPVRRYRRVSSWLIRHGMTPVAALLLRLKDRLC